MNISGIAGFSMRELRMIGLLATGATTKESAAELRVSESTVYNYTIYVYRKMGFNKRRELIAWAKEFGMDDPSMVAPGTPEICRSRNRKMRGFFGRRPLNGPGCEILKIMAAYTPVRVCAAQSTTGVIHLFLSAKNPIA
jgi:DNA-binding CsgD family transcriptional regulator